MLSLYICKLETQDAKKSHVTGVLIIMMTEAKILKLRNFCKYKEKN